jgi:DNA-binding transcriptional LysR family regulator
MIDDLKAFIAVFDDPSLTRAADKLCLTQSAVSRRIQQLEALLGGTLFDRSSKPLRPTLLARRIHLHARELLRHSEELMLMAREDGGPDGILRLGVTQCVGDVALPELLSRLTNGFPALDVQLQCDWTAALLERASSGQVDIAIALMRHGATFTPPLEGHYVNSLETVVVQSKAHPRSERRTGIAALAAHEWILNAGGCGYRVALERAMAAQGSALRVFVDSQGIEGQLRLIASGLGLGMVPREFLRTSPIRNELTVVDVSDFSLTIDVCPVHGTGLGNLPKTLGALADAIKERFGQSETQLAEQDAVTGR